MTAPFLLYHYTIFREGKNITNRSDKPSEKEAGRLRKCEYK
jgi:hypothetical protein